MNQGLRRKVVAAALAMSVAAAGSVMTSNGAQAGKPPLPPGQASSIEGRVSNEKALYVVQMSGQPVVAYDGSVRGLAATKPARGTKINPNSANVKKYVNYLDGTHDAALAKIGGRKVYDYRYTFNGFAAELTEAQAAKMRGVADVVAVSKNEVHQLDTADTPEFLGLSDVGGLWEQLGGAETGKKQGGAGEGVIVGVIDSGIWPESQSFSDRDSSGRLVYQQIPGWHGKCTPGEAWNASMCNQKLIGAQYFNVGFGGKGYDYEFNSARDADGHGTHTASTAAGNYGVDTGVILVDTPLGAISGMAPRARVAAYKVCWGIAPEGGCATVDSVAAIDQAVADGVDVINFSISGTPDAYMDPVEIAFLFAADAGVFVAASAGNGGPGASTLNHPSPWLTTVAASTHNRVALGSGTLGDGTPLTGASVSAETVGGPLVYAGDVALDTAASGEAALCYPGTLDPDKVAGTIVACDRGVIARVDKSAAVAEAGGVGVFLMNTEPSSLNADLHSVPTLHVDETQRTTILDYIAHTTEPTGVVNMADVRFDGDPEMASFSSRGPILGGDADVLKPDITAPGVDVLAAVSPYSSGGAMFDFLSGTSMSSPHMAGIAALIVDAHPDWTPMMVKSALMTTAGQDVTDDGNDADAFDFGAGHVQPNSAVDPGLVYDAGWVDWLGFLCGTGDLNEPFCSSIEIDPSDLNQASITVGSLAGSQTVTRRVTNVGSSETFTAEIVAPPGVAVEVSPNTLSLAPGQTATVHVTLTTETAVPDSYVQGALTWVGDQGHRVRSPLVVRPVALAAPAEVLSSGDSLSFEVGFGASGPFSVFKSGLVAAQTFESSVADDPDNDINTALGTGVGIDVQAVVIPEGSTMARFALFDDYTSGQDDLDLYVFDAGGAFAGSSGSVTSAEQVDLVFDDPLTEDTVYLVVTHGWQTAGGGVADYTLFAWGLPAVDATNMSVVAPSEAALGGVGVVVVDFVGLDADRRYLGALDYEIAGSPSGRTIVRVNTD